MTSRRASVEGLRRETFRVGHLAQALLEGTVAGFRAQYDEMVRLEVRPRRRVVGAGNATGE